MKEEKIWAVKDGYLVLRNGTIFRLNWRNTGKCVEVKQRQRDDGYLDFKCNGKPVLTHRFIAECFLPNPDNLSEINHKDENKANNCVRNLEWCTRRYNLNYGTYNKRVSERMKKYWGSEENRKKQSNAQLNNPKKSKKVLQYAKNGVLVKEWCSISEIRRVLGFDMGLISACCKGKLKSAYDYIWKFKDDLLS